MFVAGSVMETRPKINQTAMSELHEKMRELIELFDR